MKADLQGLVAAPHTPFLDDGELALDVIPRLAALLARNRVNGAFICGTTGEGMSMTMDERRKVAEAWRRAAPPALKLIIHVGHLSLGESRALARHAQDIGADAIATIAPSFFKPAGASELVAWCEQVAAAAPRLPFYYYHMPAMTGLAISATGFLEHCRDRIPTLAGIKFTDEDLIDYGQAAAAAGSRYAILFGRDEILLDGLNLGACGAVGSTYNFAAPLFHRLIHAFQAKDFDVARREQARACAFIDVLNRFGGIAAGKAVMKLIGIDCGPVRLPLRRLTAEQEDALRAELERIEFFTYQSAVA